MAEKYRDLTRIEDRLVLYREKMQEFRLMDDTFMSVVFSKTECAELLLRIILDREDLRVVNVTTQQEIYNMTGRSVRLDIYAVDAEGKAYDVEVQRSDAGAAARRARYNSGALDANALPSGKEFDYKDLPETYVIFITENDVLGDGLPIYHIERKVIETDKLFCDGEHIIYVNSQIRDETPLGKLMRDFYCADTEEMNYNVLREEAGNIKNMTEGGEDMCRIMEEIADMVAKDYAAKAEAETKEENAKRMLQDGMPAEKVALYVNLPVEEVRQLAETTPCKP